jgi:hypothetical protein
VWLENCVFIPLSSVLLLVVVFFPFCTDCVSLSTSLSFFYEEKVPFFSHTIRDTWSQVLSSSFHSLVSLPSSFSLYHSLPTTSAIQDIRSSFSILTSLYNLISLYSFFSFSVYIVFPTTVTFYINGILSSLYIAIKISPTITYEINIDKTSDMPEKWKKFKTIWSRVSSMIFFLLPFVEFPLCLWCHFWSTGSREKISFSLPEIRML